MKITVQISVKADGIRAPYPAAFTFDYEHNAGDNPAFYGSEVQEAVGSGVVEGDGGCRAVRPVQDRRGVVVKVERFEQAHQLAEGQLGHRRRRQAVAGPENPAHAHGDDAPLPWSTVTVVPDDELVWWIDPSIVQPIDNSRCRGQRLLWASPPYGPSCTLTAGHDGDCVFPETWIDPKTGKTIDVATHGRTVTDPAGPDLVDVLKTRIGEAS